MFRISQYDEREYTQDIFLCSAISISRETEERKSALSPCISPALDGGRSMHNKYESSMCYLERSVSFSPFSMFLFTEALPAEDGLVALALLLGVAAALEAAALEEASREGERRRRGEGAERGRVLVPGKVKEDKT